MTRSSGNVFADLGLPDSSSLLLKSEIAFHIVAIIDDRRLTQAKAAEALGIDQPGVSDLIRGDLRGISTDRLLRYLNALGRDVDIVIRPRSRSPKRAGIRVIERKLAG